VEYNLYNQVINDDNDRNGSKKNSFAMRLWRMQK